MIFKINKSLSLLAICFIMNVITAQSQSTKADSIRTLIVFFDGLRPDYITAEAMPNVYAFKKTGCYGKQHHSVFPTVTRVNATSYSTGSYPAMHGIMGNTVYFSKVNAKKGLNTGDAAELNKINQATDGHLLTAVSIGEIMQQAGKKMMVFSSGSTGSALLQNHTICSGAIINPEMILPESFKAKVINEIGPIPANGKTKTPQHIWITDALIKYALKLDGPLVSSIWFTDPDHTAHSDGIGSPTAMASIKIVDEQFGRIIDALGKKGLTQYFNIIISADHGFVTHAGTEGLTEFLIKEGLKKDKESDEIIIADGALYVKDHDVNLIQKTVTALQKQEWAGAIFTKSDKPGNMKGFIKGTLSFESIHWNHLERSADILVDANWDDRKNNAGYEGASYNRGVAGHGSLSPYEVHIPLLASGPSFKQSYESELPTSNVDIVPTVLHIHHLPVPTSMDGRVMTELLAERSNTPIVKVKKEIIETLAKYDGGTYNLILERSVIGKYKYVNFSKIIRTSK